MLRSLAILFAGVLCVIFPDTASGQAKTLALTSTAGLMLHNAIAEAVTFKGKQAVRVTIAPESHVGPSLPRSRSAVHRPSCHALGTEATQHVLDVTFHQITLG